MNTHPAKEGKQAHEKMLSVPLVHEQDANLEMPKLETAQTSPSRRQNKPAPPPSGKPLAPRREGPLARTETWLTFTIILQIKAARPKSQHSTRTRSHRHPRPADAC